MNNIDKELLYNIRGGSEFVGAYNIRKDGKTIEREITENVSIVTKEDKSGINIYVKDDSVDSVDIPVLLTEEGINDTVYNDFYIGKNSIVTIVAGCGIHSEYDADSEHDGIHRFYISEGAKVKYIEKHYGDGVSNGKKILNPVTEVYMQKGSSMEMDTSQIKGVDKAKRTTIGELDDGATLIINEKIMTDGHQNATTNFKVKLNGKNSSVKVTSRAVATEKSKQEFNSYLEGNNECFGHVECDAIIKDSAKVISTPKINANNVDARLIHEATIGKIAGDELKKLMTLGLTQDEAERVIIGGFLK